MRGRVHQVLPGLLVVFLSACSVAQAPRLPVITASNAPTLAARAATAPLAPSPSPHLSRQATPVGAVVTQPCSTCHDPRRQNAPATMPLPTPGAESAVCDECHASWSASSGHTGHQTISCLACHSPHGGEQ